MRDILPIRRTKQQARKYYNRISPFYDWMASSEAKYVDQGIELLSINQNENILEIGSGSGRGLLRISEKLKHTGNLLALDISHRMLIQAKQKLSTQTTQALAIQGDGEYLPLRDNLIDGVFCSFTLELFSEEGIRAVLNEIKRILKPNGRLVVVSLADRPNTIAKRIYEIGHSLFPVILDCRPLPLSKLLRNAQFEIKKLEQDLNFGLPIQMALARTKH